MSEANFRMEAYFGEQELVFGVFRDTSKRRKSRSVSIGILQVHLDTYEKLPLAKHRDSEEFEYTRILKCVNH